MKLICAEKAICILLFETKSNKQIGNSRFVKITLLAFYDIAAEIVFS